MFFPAKASSPQNTPYFILLFWELSMVEGTRLSELSDEALMLLIQKQDEPAFATLVDRYLAALHAFARRMLGNTNDAEDIVQEAFLRVWCHAAQWKPGQAKLSTWLHRIIHNLCIDLRRRSQRRETVDIDTEEIQEAISTGVTPEACLQEEQLSQEVEQALQILPERQRSAILLCYYQGLSNLQAAEVLNISVAALESLMARGRRTLRQKLQNITTGGTYEQTN
jgi:RNA polymerase sigma-70 factor (ECF subfamily)